MKIAAKTAAKTASKKTAAKTAAKKSTTGREGSMSNVALEMVVAGKTNEEITKTLVKDFDLDVETHGHYAGWYRIRAAKLGLVSKDFARKHAHAADWKRANAKPEEKPAAKKAAKK